jgi:hypothetical protein
VPRSGTTFCAPTTQTAWAAPPAFAGSWLPLPEARTSEPVSVTEGAQPDAGEPAGVRLGVEGAHAAGADEADGEGG